LNDLKNFELKLDGNVLERVSSTKFLGVFIDEKVEWKEHIIHISLKISQSLGIMRRVKNIVSHRVMLILYYTLIYPYLSYCNIVWGSANASSIYKVVCLQKIAVRLIT